MGPNRDEQSQGGHMSDQNPTSDEVYEFQVVQGDSEQIVVGRPEAVRLAKELSADNNGRVSVARTDGRVRMEFSDGRLENFFYDTRDRRGPSTTSETHNDSNEGGGANERPSTERASTTDAATNG